MHSAIFRRLIPTLAVMLAGALPLLLAPAASAAKGGSPAGGHGSQLLAQAAAESADGTLEPRYEPREPQPKSAHNSSYIFGMTRGLADSTIHPAVKAPLFLLTLPLDLVLLPFAAIGGMFG